MILPLCGYQGKNSVNLLWATPPLVHPGERGVEVSVMGAGHLSWEAEVRGKGTQDLPRPAGEPVMIAWLSLCPGLGDTW